MLSLLALPVFIILFTMLVWIIMTHKQIGGSLLKIGRSIAAVGVFLWIIFCIRGLEDDPTFPAKVVATTFIALGWIAGLIKYFADERTVKSSSLKAPVESEF